MRQYELTYLISDLVPESDLNKVTGKIGGYISSLGGKTIKEEIWGRRKLAYPIQKQDFATYVTIVFELSADKAKELEHNINLTSKVVRHLMIILKAEATTLSLTKEDIAETKEIEEAVGGEKSFEMIEGMTDESRGLMSLRDNEETAPTLRSESRHEIVGKDSRDLMAVRGEDEEEKAEEIEAPMPQLEVEDAESSDESAHSGLSESSDRSESIGKVVEEKPAKPKKEKADIIEAPAKEEKKVKAPTLRSEPSKKSVGKESNEADRLSMLDKELDDILGDEIK